MFYLPGKVADIALGLYPQLEEFSLNLCTERDTMIHDFRSLVDAYVLANNNFPYMELSFHSVLISPWWEHVLRFLNIWAGIE